MIASANHTKRELAGLIGRPLRTIQFWTDIGLVIPEILPSRGKGKPRIYSPKNQTQLSVNSNPQDIKACKKYDLPYDQDKFTMRHILKTGINRLGMFK